jgi:hypothetical protein
MEEEVKLRLDEIDKRVSAAEKRFDDVKWCITGLSGGFGFIFSVVVLVAAWDLNRERAGLRDIEKDIKEGNVEKDTKDDARNLVKDLMDQIRERFGQPVQRKLELFGANGVALDGQEMVPQPSKR